MHLNLPTAHGYDPSLPRVMRLRLDEELASDLVLYMDNGWSMGRGEERCKETGWRLSSKMNSLGQQDAACKRRPCSLYPGAWKGDMLHCGGPYPEKSITQEKWEKFGAGLRWIKKEGEDKGEVDTVLLR